MIGATDTKTPESGNGSTVDTCPVDRVNHKEESLFVSNGKYNGALSVTKPTAISLKIIGSETH